MTKLLRYKSIYSVFTVKHTIIFKALSGSLIICFLLCACSKKQTEPQIEPPQAVTALTNDIEANNSDCECHPYVSQYIWKNENVYVLAYNDALNIGYVCDWIPILYDSNGQTFTLKAGYSYQNFLKDSRLIRNVWACE